MQCFSSSVFSMFKQVSDISTTKIHNVSDDIIVIKVVSNYFSVPFNNQRRRSWGEDEVCRNFLHTTLKFQCCLHAIL